MLRHGLEMLPCRKKIAGFYSEVKQEIVILIQTNAAEMMGSDKLRLLCLQSFFLFTD
jgi:hypothetical protein